MQKLRSINNATSIKNLEMAASSIPGIISWKDTNSTYLGMNEFALTMSGLKSFNDVIGKNDYDLWPKFARHIVEHDQTVIITGAPLQTEECITQPDGTVIYLSIVKAPLLDDNGNIIGIVSNASDITKQKKKRLEYLEDLAPSIPGPIYWKDRNSRYLGLNKFALDASGLNSFSDFIGKTDHDLWPQFADEIVEHDQEVIQTGKTIHEDGAINLPDGTIRHFIAIKVPLRDDDDNIIGIIGNYVDITAQKEAEQLRLENEVHKKLALEQGKFTKLANQVAHDIRSPLASLLMIVKSCDQIPELERIALREAAIGIGDIANHLLNQYDKKESHDAKNEVKSPLLVSTVLLELLTSKKYQYKKLSVQFDYQFEHNAQFTFIKTQVSAFKRMISNLINNAVDALEGAAGTVKLHLAANPEWVTITLQDTGKGMTPDLIDKIMHKKSVSVGKKDGHGIGLMQVWETLERNQGELHIHSELKKGTTITLTFPKMSTPNWIAKEIILNPNDTVIILDDDTSIHGAWRTRFETILIENLNLNLKHFTEGKEALEYICALTLSEKQKIFLLTDYELLKQELNGLYIIEKSAIKRSILVTSHYADPLLQEQIIKTNTKILPKQLACEISINVLETEAPSTVEHELIRVDIIIVDDDKSFAKNLALFVFDDQIVKHFHDPELFLQCIHQYPKNTKIYLDNNFDSSRIKGVDLAKELHAQGYEHLYLLSGETFNEGELPSYLTVIRKDDIANLRDL